MDDPPDYADELKQLFRMVKSQYAAIKQKAASYVVRHEWTNGMRYDLRPFYHERIGQRRADTIPPRPTGSDVYCYGISAENRVITEDWYYRGALAYEAFWQNLPDKIEIMTYENGAILRIGRLDSSVGVPQQYRQYERKHGGESYERELYTAENGRIVKIAWEHSRWYETVRAEAYCFYDDDGELGRIEGSPGFMGFVPQIYTRPVKTAASSGPISAKARQKVVNGIVDAVAHLKITAPVCALIISYSDLEGMFPPLIGLLEESERQKRVDAAETTEIIWALPWVVMYDLPYSNPVDVNDPALQKQWDSLEQKLDNDQARTLFAQVAADLLLVDWTGKLPVTDDFIAFAIDPESDSAVERIIESVPQNRVDKLREKGLL